MDTQFSVVFTQNNVEPIPCIHFREAADGEYLKESTMLTENLNLAITFKAPPGFKLYMDGIDLLPNYQVRDDQKGYYVEPSEKPYTLYDYHLKNSQYPFIPGTYFLTVATPEGKEYDSRITVSSKHLNDNQHITMISEIESFLQGLAMDASHRRGKYYHQVHELFGMHLADKYTYILHCKNKIIHGLQVITKNRRYTIQKNYPIVPKNKAKRIDHRSMRYLSTHPEQQTTIQVPQAFLSYQTNENSWLKQILTRLLKQVVDMKHVVDRLQDSKYTVLRKEIHDLHYYLQSFLNEKWITDINLKPTKPIPTVFFTVGSYAVFYKIDRYINGKQHNREVVPSKQFHYKRSDILFEIWGYLKIVQSLVEKEGYKLSKNWFKLNRSNLDEIIVPQSSGFDVIELEKEDIKLRVFYDEILPKAKKEITPDRTLYNLNHNRPDCRIDVWRENEFKGSMVIDFKYRRRYAIWDDQLLHEEKEATKVMKQLVSYAEGMKTSAERLNGNNNRQLDRSPVEEVWAIYPQEKGRIGDTYELNDYNIRLIDLTPGSESMHFDQILAKAVGRLIEA